MKTTYGLDEVWVPEDEDLEEEYHHLPRSNIYMSKDFRKNFDQNQIPADKKALILI